MKFTRDNFQRKRGGYSRLLQLNCEKCGAVICYYQKDGPGIIKRIYKDRMIDFVGNKSSKTLSCAQCKETLGILGIYKKENRPAYRVFAGAISKKIVPITTL